ncbi:putative carboxymethylenebutenolidase [Chlorella vulgaris]
MALEGVEKITFGDGLPGYVCGSVKDPAVIVIQEWWGVVPTVVAHAVKLSEQGYRCLIPDIYRGKVGVNKEEASHLLSKLDWAQAVQDIKQAVGAIGFCMGGALSLAAAQLAGVDCAVAFYGTPAAELSQPQNIKVPVSLHFGELDDHKGFSDPETGKKFADSVTAAGGSAELFVYEAAGHGFLNTGEAAVATREHMGFPEPPAEAQQLAWTRISAFLDGHLRPQQ